MIRVRPSVAALLSIVVLVTGACGASPGPNADAAGEPSIVPAPTRRPVPRPAPGHEVYGYVPYWEMDGTIAAHLDATPLTTLALFSVTTERDGSIDKRQPGYRSVTGVIGQRLAREAHERGVRVELVFSSFGLERNRAFLGDESAQASAIDALVALAGHMGVDGINVDVEGMEPLLLPAYGSFLEDLRAALVEADAGDTMSVATGANALGAAMGRAAADAGADRIFVMGYDYRTGGSDPGATAPLDRNDGARTLRTTLDAYEAVGVPLERTILGLPLYGVTWPVAGPVVGAPRTGRGEAWIPRRHLDLFAAADAVPVRDDVEAVDVYFVTSDGTFGPPSPGAPEETGAAEDPQWNAVYVDAADTLAQKLALANERGLAGGGFWAVGYERGRPEITELLERFAAGDPIG